ncbi:unnamed protein product [Rotaria magnacalcarata]|uniref:HORMA domain-containing protein n=3 Tax=Rotaria magnacalcarata TaxID=392030 RepID=A0A816QTV7_9BILA|nr:unnamed protein product [Rotaria magnacalcarata]CAF2052887.1 unnamed protein product [Rotaria magnacalcarata]CAF2064118.1 unnamed protein product [Rotaria magnacalcarata]CAF4149329.1 unnamed protein product [Rotaria magnacalcarata]CAF4264535.1 unnamed protein product [Rotaria magnacalcarata]
MEMNVNTPHYRRQHGEIRLLEKQIRPEILERCLQFIDIVINQIIYQENIYPSNLFVPRQMYRSLVYQCIDKDISSYITLCVASLRNLLSQQLSDMIAINIIRNFQNPIILRRYLIELHTIHDPCLRAIYDNTKQLINQLDRSFSECIRTIKQIKPLDNHNYNKQWTFQLRSSPDRTNNKGISIKEILRTKPIYKEFLLINQQSDLLSNSKQSIISSIKSLHTERIKLQFMCEDDKYEQEKFQQWNQYLLKNTSIGQQDIDYATDSDIDEYQENFKETDHYSRVRNKRNESALWPLTTTNNPPICAIDEENMNSNDIERKSNDRKRSKKNKITTIDVDLLVDRYHLSHDNNKDDFDALLYSSEDEDQLQLTYSPDTVRRDGGTEEDEDNDDEDF